MIKEPVSTRRRQIEKEIARIHEQSTRKSQRDDKTVEAFSCWKRRNENKLDELYSELAILDYPDGYYEVPLAIAAAELGLTLDEMIGVVHQELTELSFKGEYLAGCRITRDELARMIDFGAENLLAVARQTPAEIFETACPHVKRGEVETLQKAYDRIERNDSCINPFAIALEIGIQFIKGDIEQLRSSLDFISGRDVEDLAAILVPLKSVVEQLNVESHPMEVIKEKILATADGVKETPFRNTYSYYNRSKRRSQMDENQRRSLFIADVVVEALEKYKFTRSIESARSFSSGRKEEIETLISNAIFTALEAERSYQESATSRLFVDKFVELSPKWSRPPQTIVLLPKQHVAKQ